MDEHPYLTELANATSIGLLAGEMVFVVGELLEKNAQPDDGARKIIESGRSLLASVANPTPGGAQHNLDQLAESEGALDTIQAVLAQAPDGDVESYMSPLENALRKILDEHDDPVKYASELNSVRELFAMIGQLTLSRANRLTRSPQEQLQWPGPLATSTS